MQKLKGMELKYALIRKRAAEERFEPPSVSFRPLNYEPDIDNPKYVIRAVYGPATGISASRIQTYLYDERYLKRRGVEMRPSDLVGAPRDDGAGVPGQAWGPRRFLWELFNLVGQVGGDCTIFMIHSEQVVQVDAKAFADWVHRSKADPATALLEPRKLLEG